MSLQRSIHSVSFCLTLASSASGVERTRWARPNLPSFVRPLARGIGIPLTFAFARSLSYARFLSVPLNGDEDSLAAWLIVGRQESAAGTSSPGIAVTPPEILGYWLWGLQRWAIGRIEISAPYPEVELKETGPLVRVTT